MVNVLLPQEKTKPKNKLEDYSHLWFGPPKIGKSSIAAQFPNALFLATEPGHDALSILKVDVTEWDQFDNIIEQLYDGKHDYQTVIVDTVDNAYDLCRQSVQKDHKVEHWSDISWGKGYDLVDERFQTTFNDLARLPYGLIFISHLNYEEVKKPSGDSFTLANTTMNKRCRKYITGLVSFIWYFAFEGQARLLHTQPDTHIEAGSRLVLPEKIDLGKAPEDGYRNILSAFYGRNGSKTEAKNELVDLVLEAEGVLAKAKIDEFNTEKRKINSRKKHLHTEDVMKANLETLQGYLQHLGNKYNSNNGGQK